MATKQAARSRTDEKDYEHEGEETKGTKRTTWKDADERRREDQLTTGARRRTHENENETVKEKVTGTWSRQRPRPRLCSPYPTVPLIHRDPKTCRLFKSRTLATTPASTPASTAVTPTPIIPTKSYPSYPSTGRWTPGRKGRGDARSQGGSMFWEDGCLRVCMKRRQRRRVRSAPQRREESPRAQYAHANGNANENRDELPPLSPTRLSRSRRRIKRGHKGARS